MKRTQLPWRDALARILTATPPLEPVDRPTTADLHGCVLAKPAAARWNLPPTNVSVMDGYAAHSGDLEGDQPVVLKLAGESAAGHPMNTVLPRGHVARISTGAVLPEGADIVVPQEDTRREGDRLHVDLEAFGDVTPLRWVRAAGSDVRRDETVLFAGQRLLAGDLAMAASAGHTTLTIHPPPRVAIVSTGDELLAREQTPSQGPRPGSIISSNDLMLAAAVRDAGGTPIDLGIAPDDPQGLAAVLREALRHDVVLTTGGVSVGDHDLVAETFSSLGVTFDFHGIALRPGKPLAYGRGGNTVVLGLPGNPASAWVTFRLFGAPTIAKLRGERDCEAPASIEVRLRNRARGAGRRTHMLRAQLFDDGTASILDTQVSGNLRSLCRVDALIEVPAGLAEIAAGEQAVAFPMHPFSPRRAAPCPSS